MVYLRTIINENKAKLASANNIEFAAYLGVTNKEDISSYSFNLSPQEAVALKGYSGDTVSKDEVLEIFNKKAVKGVDATSNIYKFAGLYLAAKDDLKGKFEEKYNSGNLKQKYFLTLVEPNYSGKLLSELSNVSDPTTLILKVILEPDSVIKNLDAAIVDFCKADIGVEDLLILEGLEKALIKTKYNNQTAEELVRSILNNFGNSVNKIIKGRRQGHPDFEIKDEYDVQDVLYVILKSVFPNLRDEDAIAKVGAKSTKIDLIIREEGLLIEAKMMKQSDSNETKFIEELKIDFESYHECKWLKKLFCFVYDPLKKTRDISNFNDLNGKRNKNGHEFEVEVIVIN
ncbi:MAG: hypothetical protein JNJ40_15195 [Bacteroidia bacterium]|nr:hypothetical protein [Bacteroidia bacterium]